MNINPIVTRHRMCEAGAIRLIVVEWRQEGLIWLPYKQTAQLERGVYRYSGFNSTSSDLVICNVSLNVELEWRLAFLARSIPVELHSSIIALAIHITRHCRSALNKGLYCLLIQLYLMISKAVWYQVGE